jgi:hypothetical protein
MVQQIRSRCSDQRLGTSGTFYMGINSSQTPGDQLSSIGPNCRATCTTSQVLLTPTSLTLQTALSEVTGVKDTSVT